MKLYNADMHTGEYLEGHDVLAFENPKYNPDTHDESDRWLYNDKTSSLIKPPIASSNEVVILENREWVIMPDFRGTKFWLSDGSEHNIVSIGHKPPSGCMTTPPPSKWHKTHDSSNWIEDVDGKFKHQEEYATKKRYELYTAKDGTDAALIEYLREKFKDDPVVAEINERVAKIKADNPKPV